jgi:hypothetical protein
MMRKVVAGALAAAALAWAGGASAADAEKERKEAADATKQEARQEAKQAQQSMENAADRTAAGAKDTARDAQAGASAKVDEAKKHPLFEGKNNFDVDGKVQQVSGDKITIQREGLPAATLHVSSSTKIEMDGKKVSTQQLQRGQDVKASFNLQGDKPEAVEIKADKPKSDDRKEMTEQQRETQKDLSERQQKAQQAK